MVDKLTNPIGATATPGLTAPCGGGSLAGYRILAAEDCLVNRLVLEEMLTRRGANLVCVGDGGQAVERVRQDGADAYDIVLTDVQMPGMNGYETAVRLRELAPTLPVIGLTAGTLAEDRDACLAAGMVDHVYKPFDLDTLIKTIRRHGRQPEAVPAGGDIDWRGLAARFGNRDGFVDKLAATLCACHADTAARLRAAAREQDMAQLTALAHTLKGMGGNLMARQLQDLAARTERAARTAAPDTAALAELLAAAVEEALAALAARPAAEPGASR